MDSYDILKKHFGYSSFRGKQEEIIDHLLAGRHALVIMPTGMGKSLCYQIPALLLSGLTIVISPLIALMKDQVDVLVKKNIDAAYVNSSLTKKERESRYKNLAKGKYSLLYVTPERFRKQDFVETIRKRKVSLLAVDEAHCISEWGHDFRPDYTRVREFRKLLGNPTTIALTATATPDVQSDIVKQLGIEPSEITSFHEGIERKNLKLHVSEVWGDKKKLDQIIELRRRQPGNGIVYFSLIKTLMRFSEELDREGINHLCYHGDLDTRTRKHAQDAFMQGQNNMVLATNAFGMGIDKEDIRFVVHAEMPGSMESYYQEIGRAGRDGLSSDCILLYDEQDLLIHMDFIKWNNPGADFYKQVYHILADDPEHVLFLGTEGLKEKLHFKSKRDFRLETSLRMLDRYGVTEGSLDQKDLIVCSPLPAQLSDRKLLDEKLKREQNKLYSLVQYVKSDGCRKAFIHEYFGLPHADRCGSCDRC